MAFFQKAQNKILFSVFFGIIFFSTGIGSLLSQMNTDSLESQLSKSDSEEKIILLNKLAFRYSPESPEKSISYAADALSLSKKSGNREQEAAALRNLADSYFYLDNLNEAIKYYQASANIYLELGGTASKDYIGRIGDVAYCYDMLNEYALALRYYQQNIEYARAAGNLPEVAANLANAGRIFTIWGEYGTAIELMEEALEIDRTLDKPELLATDYNTIGKIFSYWGEHEKAIDYFEKSLKINQDLNMPVKVAIRLNSIGDVCRAQGDYNKALNYFNQALEIDRETANELQMGVRYNNIAKVYLDQGNTEKARAYIIQAESIFRKYNDELNLVSALLDLGQIEFLEKNYQPSITCLQEAYMLADEKNMNHQKVTILELLSKAHEQSGNFKMAYASSMEHDSVEDLIFTNENSRQISAFQAKYEVEQERQKSLLLEKDKRIQRNTIIIVSIALSAAILLLASFIIILRLRSTAVRQENEIATRKAESLEKELEIRNKELAISAMNIIRNNESMMQMADMIQSSVDDGDPPQNLQKVIQSLRSLEHDRNWEEFEIRFTQVYQDFYKRLDAKYPDLTPNERRLCAFLKLNMSTKEIASITRQSVKSINVARTRLRKKLGISHSDENMIGFLSRI